MLTQQTKRKHLLVGNPLGSQLHFEFYWITIKNRQQKWLLELLCCCLEQSTFTGKDPDLLERYSDHIEQLLKSCNITDEQEKKKYLVKYTSPSVEREWKGLDRYDLGFTYDEFKEDILDSYLETSDASMGVYQRLTNLNQRYWGLGINEGGRVFDYIRGFQAAGKELLGKNKMTSRELVTEFLATLEPTFGHSLTVRLAADSVGLMHRLQ